MAVHVFQSYPPVMNDERETHMIYLDLAIWGSYSFSADLYFNLYFEEMFPLKLFQSLRLTFKLVANPICMTFNVITGNLPNVI